MGWSLWGFAAPLISACLLEEAWCARARGLGLE